MNNLEKYVHIDPYIHESAYEYHSTNHIRLTSFRHKEKILQNNSI